MSNSLQPHGCSMPGFPVLHHLLELSRTHVHWISDAIQPSHPLSPPSPPAFSLSQRQDLFQWVGSLHQVSKVLELQLQHQSFQWIFRIDLFRMDWFDLLAVQGTLKSLLQHYSSKASVLRLSSVQFSLVQSFSCVQLFATPWNSTLIMLGKSWAVFSLSVSVKAPLHCGFLELLNMSNIYIF